MLFSRSFYGLDDGVFLRQTLRNLFDIESFIKPFSSIPRNIILVFALFDSRLFFLESAFMLYEHASQELARVAHSHEAAALVFIYPFIPEVVIFFSGLLTATDFISVYVCSHLNSHKQATAASTVTETLVSFMRFILFF